MAETSDGKTGIMEMDVDLDVTTLISDDFVADVTSDLLPDLKSDITTTIGDLPDVVTGSSVSADLSISSPTNSTPTSAIASKVCSKAMPTADGSR